MTPTTPSVTETHIRELLAFELNRMSVESAEPQPTEVALANAAEIWRNLPAENRAKVRACADRVISRLDAAGLALRSANSRKALATLDTIITIPAHPAYELGEPTQVISKP